MFRTILLVAVMAGPVQAGGLTGVYQTQANDQGQIGQVEFYDCGGKTCGKLIRSLDTAGKEIPGGPIGRNIVAGMTDRGDGAFDGGTIWDPGNDKTYKSKMQVQGNRLNVSGCIAMFCRTQVWTRVR